MSYRFAYQAIQLKVIDSYKGLYLTVLEHEYEYTICDD